MSDVLGVNKTKIDTPTPANRLKPGEYDGRVKVMTDLFEALALVQGSTIKMGGKIPKGAIVLAVLLTCDALGVSSTLDIGDAEDDDRYFSAHDSSAALINEPGDEVDGVNYEVDETDADNLDSQIVITTAGASITGTIKLAILYAHD